MTKKEALKWQKKLLKETSAHIGKAEFVKDGDLWGLSIDGDGSPQYPFGYPKIIWDVESAESFLESNFGLPKSEV